MASPSYPNPGSPSSPPGTYFPQQSPHHQQQPHPQYGSQPYTGPYGSEYHQQLQPQQPQPYPSYPGGYGAYPQPSYPAPPQAPSFPAFNPSNSSSRGPSAAASPLHAGGAAALSSSSSFQTYGQQPLPTPPASKASPPSLQPYRASTSVAPPLAPAPATPVIVAQTYVPQQPSREAVADAAIAATAEHWVKVKLQRESERRHELMHGSGDGTTADGQARENKVRRVSSAGTAATTASPFGADKRVEFRLGSPRHVVRLALLFICTLFGVLPLMSSFAFTVLLCGIVLVYICDFLDYHRTTVFVLLGTAAFFALALLLSNLHAAVTSLGPMLIVLDLGAVLAVVVAAAVQHFRWVQETFPNVLCTLERLVFAVGPVVCLPLLLMTTIALVGSRYAPFAFFGVVCTLHNFFYCPLKSSFLVLVSTTEEEQAGGGVDTQTTAGKDDPTTATREDGVHVRRRTDGVDNERSSSQDSAPPVAADGASAGDPLQLNEQVEALLFSCVLIFLPVVVYNGLQSNWPENVVPNLLNSLGLVCGGIAYFCVAPLHSLWFLASPSDSTYSIAQQLEYDPLGLMDLIGVYRMPILTGVSMIGAHWGAYRVLTSRYAYLFSGIPAPFNGIVLLLALYIAAYVAIEIKKLIDVDNSGGDVTKGKYLAQRVPILVGTCVVASLVCALMSAPGVFYFPCVLSVAALNLFLTDRTNGGPMFTFTVFTSLLLLWWMYRTYSFIVIDLRVFGESTVVPTPVLGVSVLWCYVLGCMSFTMAFGMNKGPVTLLMFMVALQITFVEHVLYSQKEEGAYPALLVIFTSAVGIAVPCRMYANGALPIESASLIASAYVAKLFTFVVEVTSAYYAAELEVDDWLSAVRPYLLIAEMTGGWWVALCAANLIATFEIGRRRKVKVAATHGIFLAYAALALLLALLTIRNVQRAVYEFVTQSYVAERELVHIAGGTFCVTYALLTIPVWWRLRSKYAVVHRLQTLSRAVAALGVVLLAVQPTRIHDGGVDMMDTNFTDADYGRYGALVGLLMLVAFRLTFTQRIPFVLRALWWLGAAAGIALGIASFVQYTPSVPFFAHSIALVFSILLLIDVAHYREVGGAALIVLYGLSVSLIPLLFLQFNRTIVHYQKLRSGPEGLSRLWDSYELGSMRLLSIVVVMHLGLAVLLNCRLNGKPLLPRCKQISSEVAASYGVVVNFSVELSVLLLSAINFYGNDSEPVLYVMSAALLLLFVDDDVLFFQLKEHNFRYFPPAACAFTLLWACMAWNAWSLAAAASGGSWSTGVVYVLLAGLKALLTVPAQASLLVLLWRGRKMGSSPGFVVVGSVVLDVICLLSVSSKPIQWMAIVGILGQCARLFDTQLQPTVARRRRHIAH